MKLWIARMSFNRAVRFGLEGIGLESAEEVCRSDTLFSALIHSWVDLFGEELTNQFLENFRAGRPPFRVSSAFVFSGDDLYLPRPRIPAPAFDDPALGEFHAKEINKCSYVTLETFKAWVRSKPLNVEEVLRSGDNYSKCFEHQIVPHVALDRITSASQIYRSSNVVFREDCGLWALIKASDESVTRNLNAAFHVLGERGLGGDRSLGLGGFELQGGCLRPAPQELVEVFEMSEPNGYLTLSLFHPDDEEVETINESASYAIIRRKGWISSPATGTTLKRQTVSMFAEGSVFHNKFTGHLVDVTPVAWHQMNLHCIYRNGFALMVPVRVLEET